jgi:preprotein translocase subunit SecG
MATLITVLHVLVCLFLMLTVLLQSGKGGMGAAFGGGGGTQTVFGGSGAGGFLRKMTVAAAVIFMLTSMTLAWMSSKTGTDALKRYSAQQRRAAQLKKEARENALKGVTFDGGVEQDVAGDGGTSTEDPATDTSDDTSSPAAAPAGGTPAATDSEAAPATGDEVPAATIGSPTDNSRAPPADPAANP